MQSELSVVEFIQRQLSQQEQNYTTALRNGKSNDELKKIEFEIEYLRNCRRQIRRVASLTWVDIWND